MTGICKRISRHFFNRELRRVGTAEPGHGVLAMAVNVRERDSIRGELQTARWPWTRLNREGKALRAPKARRSFGGGRSLLVTRRAASAAWSHSVAGYQRSMNLAAGCADFY